MTLAVLGTLLAVEPAGAKGPCGRSIANSCGLSSPGSYSGAVTFGGDTTYYRFYAVRGTVLNMTLTDAGPAEPCAIPTSCGQVMGYLYNLNSHHPVSYQTAIVGYNALQGLSPSTSFSVTLPASSTYVWDVAGQPSTDQFGDDVPEPYAFSIAVDPGDAQVLPSAPTVVRAPRDRGSLRAWERAIVRAHCVVGRVVHAHSSLPRGRVIAVDPRAGTPIPRGTVVVLVVSSGPRPRAGGHRKGGTHPTRALARSSLDRGGGSPPSLLS